VTDPPPDIAALAESRSQARAARDWAEADRLKAEIEAAGWRVLDRGLRSSLFAAAPADVIDAGRVRYGSVGAVPSRLADPATAVATVIVRATDEAPFMARLLDGLRAHAPTSTQVLVIADAVSVEVEALLAEPDGPAARAIGGWLPEIVWTAAPFGAAGATDAGLRRSLGAVAIVLAPSVELTGDALTPLVRALDDPTVAVAGPWGLVSSDLRRWDPAGPGDVDAIAWSAIAFRRDDLIARGPLDPAFRSASYLDVWWSLVLRDGVGDDPPRRAVALPALPIVRHDPPPGPDPLSDRQIRLDKRAFYRVLGRFGGRTDLLAAGRSGRGLRTP
jgi:cysteinyl-tRNA synthetase